MLTDLALRPGFYITLTIESAVIFLICAGFARSVGSVGVDTSQSQLFGFIGRTVAGTYGSAALDQILAKGPHRLALWIGAVPAVGFVLAHGALSLSGDKQAGVVELVLYSPVSELDYAVAGIVRDMVAIAAIATIGLLTVSVSSWMHNFAFGGWVLLEVVVVALVAAVLCLYAIALAQLFEHPAAALSSVAGVVLVFALLYLGRAAIVVEEVRLLSTVIGFVLQWLSPFFYANLVVSGARVGAGVQVVAGIAGFAALSTLMLFSQKLILRAQGARR